MVRDDRHPGDAATDGAPQAPAPDVEPERRR
jgi:hypothetical protein